MNEQSVRRYFRQKMHERRGVGKRGADKRSYVTELEDLHVLCAWKAGKVTDEQAAKFIGVDTDKLGDLCEMAINEGRELAR